VDLLGEEDCLAAALSLVEGEDYPVAVDCQEEVEAV
jgi:hypothetical protein